MVHPLLGKQPEVSTFELNVRGHALVSLASLKGTQRMSLNVVIRGICLQLQFSLLFIFEYNALTTLLWQFRMFSMPTAWSG